MSVYINRDQLENFAMNCVGGMVSMKQIHEFPGVHVPPHGRLIDADAFAAEIMRWQKSAGKLLREAKDRETAIRADAVLTSFCEVKLILSTVPTIIPASEEIE